jgi:hypothetical protein
MPTTINRAGHSTNDLASGGFAVTPSDAANLASTAYGVYIGGAGDLKVTTIDGDTITFSGLAVGQFVPVIVVKIFATGTTATNILALR